MTRDDAGQGCCESGDACVFSKALLARAASCELAGRSCVGEREVLTCGSPVARINCATLAALLHERARFALHLPPPGRPLMHVQALRLQCGGLRARRRARAHPVPDVHRLVSDAQQRHGSLTGLPWEAVVPAVAGWKPLPRGRRGFSPD